MPDYTGKIVEFLESGVAKLGLVTRQSASKIQLTDQNGKQRSLSPKSICLVHTDVTASGQTVPSALVEEIEAATADVDPVLLWESIAHDIREYSLEALAEDYFGSASTSQRSAVFRVLLDDKLRFKMRGTHVTPRDPKQVSDQIHAARRREEKERVRATFETWVKQILALESHGDAELPEELSEIVDRVEAFLMRRISDEVETWLVGVGKGTDPREVAFRLLRCIGRVPADADPLLAIAGIQEGFAPEIEAASLALEPFTESSVRRDFSSVLSFSIDDEDTREIDDAISVEFRDSGLRVGVHIADVEEFVTKGDALDRTAYGRTSSVYLPSSTTTLFPQRLGCDLASLVAGELRPCLSFVAEFDRDFELVDSHVERGQLTVNKRLSYDQADQLISPNETDDSELSRALEALDQVTEKLLEGRRSRGALTLRRPELKIWLEEDRVHLKLFEGDSESRRIVSELMILANGMAARLAEERLVPVIFRAQDPPEGEIDLPGEYDPIAYEGVFRQLRRGRLSTSPQLHAGLGMSAYTQVTSPIRRFADLVMQRQLIASLAEIEVPYSQDELVKILGVAQNAEDEIRALERQANRQFTLLYLAQNPEHEAREAIVIRRLNDGYLVEVSPFHVRGKLSSPERFEPGDHVSVLIDSVNPERDVLVFRTE